MDKLMYIKKAKKFTLVAKGLSASSLEDFASKNPAKSTSGTVKETIGFGRLFEDLDSGAKFFEYVGNCHVAKIIHESRTPSKKDIDRLLHQKKAALRRADPEIKFPRSKQIELRKECAAELMTNASANQTVFFVLIDLQKSVAFISVGSKAETEKVSRFLGQAGITVEEDFFSMSIEEDLTNLLDNPESLADGWELGKASTLANLTEKSKVSYSSQDLASEELHVNTEKQKLAVDVEFVLKESFRLRINVNQAITNIKFLQREPPEWLEYNSEKGEGGEEVDALRLNWEYDIFVVKALFDAVSELFDNIGNSSINESKYTEADLEFDKAESIAN